jgi:hypothetical protein
MVDDVWFGVHISQEGCLFNKVKDTCIQSEKHGFDNLLYLTIL